MNAHLYFDNLSMKHRILGISSLLKIFIKQKNQLQRKIHEN